MAYTPSLFVDRSVEFPGRRVLTEVVGMASTFDVTRAEGTEFAVGTMPDATNLNAEFDKIKVETDDINNSLTAKGTEVLLASTTSVSSTNIMTIPDITKFTRISFMIDDGTSILATANISVSSFITSGRWYNAMYSISVDFRGICKFISNTSIYLYGVGGKTINFYGIY